MRLGKRSNWLVLGINEEGGRIWTLSDGIKFEASASGGTSTSPSFVYADYEDDALTGTIEYRTRLIAPMSQSAGEWIRMDFGPRPPLPCSDDEDAVDEYVSNRYHVSVQLRTGKYLVEFRVQNRSGKMEECSGVIMIVSDSQDYD